MWCVWCVCLMFVCLCLVLIVLWLINIDMVMCCDMIADVCCFFFEFVICIHMMLLLIY